MINYNKDEDNEYKMNIHDILNLKKTQTVFLLNLKQ
jgi:hypothetical protein